MQWGENLLSDEDYLVERARKETDVFAAKAWIITAKTLFPRNLSIQMEAYSMEKNKRNTKDAARHLQSLFGEFPNEPALQAEMQSITQALRSNIVDAQSSFLRDVFSQLPLEVQHSVLLKAAESCIAHNDTVQHCRLMLLLLRRFPERAAQHGNALVETLLASEKRGTGPVNTFRRLLVCDVLPLILSSPTVEIASKQLLRHLFKSLEFIVTFSSQSPTEAAENFVAPTTETGTFDRPWNQLASIATSVAKKLGWELGEVLSNPSREAQWQRISSFYHRRKVLNDSDLRQLLYVNLIVFVWSLYEYSAIVNPQQFALSSGNSSRRIYLLEGFSSEQSSTKRKRKYDEIDGGENATQLTVGHLSREEAVSITHNFVSAVKCWELFKSNEILDKESSRLLHQLKCESWPWLSDFHLDLLMYRGSFQDVMARIGPNPYENDKTTLQLASCDYGLGKLASACKHVLSLVASIPAVLPSQQTATLQLSKPGRHVVFVGSNPCHLLQYCVKLLVQCLQDRILMTSEVDDTALGHLIVLLQYDWPKEEKLFLDLVQRIQTQSSFNYPLFFNYIINMDMLEEFAFLASNCGQEVSLDLLALAQNTNKSRTMNTRGINKGFREDLRCALEKQVSRCDESLDVVLQDFLANEKNSLQLVLMPK